MSIGKQESPHTTVLVATAHNTQGISKRYIETSLHVKKCFKYIPASDSAFLLALFFYCY